MDTITIRTQDLRNIMKRAKPILASAKKKAKKYELSFIKFSYTDMSLTALASDSFMVASIEARVETVRTYGGQILGGGSGEFLLPYIDVPNRGEYLNIEIEGDSIRITNDGISIAVDVPKLKATNYVDLNAVVTNADRYSQESYVVTLAVDELKLLLSSYGSGEVIRFCKTGPGQLVDTQIVHIREGELDTRVLLMGTSDPEYQKR